MKLSFKEIKLTGLWARNRVDIQKIFDFKICLRARKVSGPFEKKAPGFPPFS